MKRLIVVVDGPSVVEAGRRRAGRQWMKQDPSWHTFGNVLGKAGLSLSELTVIYLSRELIPDELSGLAGVPAKANKFTGMYHHRDGLLYPRSMADELQRGLVDGIAARANDVLVVPLGDYALAYVAGVSGGVAQWRGSELQGKHGTLIIPTYHPAYLQRVAEDSFFAIADWKRIQRRRIYRTQPVHRTEGRAALHHEILDYIEKTEGGGSLVLDIENVDEKLTWLGFKADEHPAITIHWEAFSPEIQLNLQLRLYKWMHSFQAYTAHNAGYDLGFFAYYWLWYPAPHKIIFCTMEAHRLMSPLAPKGLQDLASVYCDSYISWKRKKAAKTTTQEDALYNLRDIEYTHELADKLRILLGSTGLEAQYAERMDFLRICVIMTVRGTNCDQTMKQQVADLLGAKEEQYADKFESYFAGVATDYSHLPKSKRPSRLASSSTQLATLFYDTLGIAQPWSSKRRKRGGTADDVLPAIVKSEPLLRQPIEYLSSMRSAGVLKKVAEMELLHGRIHSSYIAGGTATSRYTSSQFMFRFGANQQNQTKGNEYVELSVTSDQIEDSDKVAKWLPDGKAKVVRRLPTSSLDYFPNMRRMVIPDPGYVLVEGDLERADAQVVVWLSGEEELKRRLREGDLHRENARDAFNLVSVDHVTDKQRQAAKAGIHSINYGAGDVTVARVLGITVKEAQAFRRNYFGRFPGVPGWHKRRYDELCARRFFTTVLGYRWEWLGRLDDHKMMPEALAFEPQKVVAWVTSKIHFAMEMNFGDDVQPLIQVHDSLLVQVKEDRVDELLPQMNEMAKIVIPFQDPLIIPFEFQRCGASWGG